MATIVSLHAHPDDECLLTGGTLARAAAEGHRVVVVTCTSGEHGEVPGDLLEGETLVDRRRRETLASAEALGVHRVEFLGYEDSGMTGWPQNEHPRAFINADLDEVAARVAGLVADENGSVVLGYDWHGGYGHPDHIMVHRVGRRVAELLPDVTLLEGTMNRDLIRRSILAARESGLTADEDDFDPDGPADDGNPMGTLEAEINLRVDVVDYVDRKRRAIACHRSQISDSAFFLAMPDEAFAMVFGAEWYLETRDPRPLRTGWIV